MVSAPPAGDVTGTWTGSTVSTGGFRSAFSGKLTQTGGNVSGTFSGNGCINGGKFTGTLSGDSLRGTVQAGDATANLTGTISEDQIDGTYDIPIAAGACVVDRGNFTMRRAGGT
jgi:hypothetical protein